MIIIHFIFGGRYYLTFYIPYLLKKSIIAMLHKVQNGVESPSNPISNDPVLAWEKNLCYKFLPYLSRVIL